MSRTRSLSFALPVALVLGSGMAGPADSRAGIKAGAAQRNITPPVGFEIQHYYRKSIGIPDIEVCYILLVLLQYEIVQSAPADPTS